jgi:hypothetical protein
MSYSYQQLLENTVNRMIFVLTTGAQPSKDPGMTAWIWFNGSGGMQPPQVNEYLLPLLIVGMKTLDKPWYQPGDDKPNWSNWASVLDVNLWAAPIGSEARKWLDLTYLATRQDPPTVPEEVINWTKDHLPTAVPPIVIRKGQGVTTR